VVCVCVCMYECLCLLFFKEVDLKRTIFFLAVWKVASARKRR